LKDKERVKVKSVVLKSDCGQREVATSELLLCETYDGEAKEKSRRTGIRGQREIADS